RDGFERVRVIGRLERYGADNAVDLDLENLLKIPSRPCRARMDAEIEHGQIEPRRQLITTNDGPIILAINGLDFIIIDIAHGSPRLAVLLAPCIIDPLAHALHRGAAWICRVIAPAAFPFQGLGKAGAEFLVAHDRPAWNDAAKCLSAASIMACSVTGFPAAATSATRSGTASRSIGSCVCTQLTTARA